MMYAVCGCWRLAGALLAVLVGMAGATSGAPAAELKGKALVEALQDGGYNIYFRHAPTDWGQHDRVIPLWVGKRLQQSIPGATLDVVPGVRHFTPEEAPRKVADAVARLLAR